MPTAQNQAGLQTRSVVSSFIFTVANGSPRVALFRRSDKVSTYHHCLAPVAGHIQNNESPVAAAWREIEEETTLTTSHLELWRQGKPFTFDDSSVGRQWTVYPFGFCLRTAKDDAIRINWEHEGWSWYDPNEVSDDEQFGGVPRLSESLRRVWFEMDMNPAAAGALRSGLEELKTDHRSGSHELTSIAVKSFRDILVHLRSDRKWWETARMAAWHLWKNGRESMGSATLNALLGVLADIDDLKDLSLDDECAMDRVLGRIDHHLEVRRQMPACIKDSFVAYLQANGSRDTQTLSILTLSASSTIRDSILDAFSSLPMPNLDLRILESRPLFEGASMASSLLSAFESKFPAATGRHLRLTVYTDASAALAATNVEFVLLGADRLSSSGWVSNKTGSLPAVLSAKHVSPSCKVLVFSGLEKVAEPGAEHEHEPEENDYREVMIPWIECSVRGVNILEEGIRGIPPKTANCHVQVKNIYFEWVPSEMIDGYICEKGMVSAAAIRKCAQEVRENSRAYFDSL